MARATGRPRSGDERLDVDRILRTALEIVDTDGTDALSMRRLGRELDVDPMAIYHHLPNKQAVVSGMVHLVFQEIEQAMDAPQPATWRDRVRSWAETYRTIARRHQPLIIHLVSNADAAGGQVMRVNERLYASLESSGMAPRDVVYAADMIVDYVHGVILGERIEENDATDWRQAFLRQINAAPEGELASMRRVFTAVNPDELEFDFRFGLDVIIAGLERSALR